MRNFARFGLLLLHKLQLREESGLGRNLTCPLKLPKSKLVANAILNLINN